MEIADIKKDINDIQEKTINMIWTYEIGNSSFIKSKLQQIVNDYKEKCNDILYSHRLTNYSSVSLARDKIYSYSNEILRDEILKYFNIVGYQVDKLEKFIKGNNFTSKQIGKISQDYNDFLKDPFRKDASGAYIGYKFDERSILSLLPSTGTAFAISSEGYLVTNYHVISNAESLFVKGIGGDFDKRYSAKVVVTDRNNDLAIIKLNDNLSKKIGKIPFVINSSIADVGENVFVLGYPLTNTMGTEIKLTNGIISSKSGFMDDITSYQISVPVQPGNSGGPLFDKRGNLIGIVNAKHSGAENVTYAIKSIYLLNLIGLLPKKPGLGTKNILGSKTLSEQNKKLEKVVYLIETN
jgi:S1-C subfamily serine protease